MVRKWNFLRAQLLSVFVVLEAKLCTVLPAESLKVGRAISSQKNAHPVHAGLFATWQQRTERHLSNVLKQFHQSLRQQQGRVRGEVGDQGSSSFHLGLRGSTWSGLLRMQTHLRRPRSRTALKRSWWHRYFDVHGLVHQHWAGRKSISECYSTPHFCHLGHKRPPNFQSDGSYMRRTLDLIPASDVFKAGAGMMTWSSPRAGGYGEIQ